MASRPQRLKRALAAILALACVGGLAGAVACRDRSPREAPSGAQRARPPQRIASLVPALTEVLFAVGAGSQVAAVSSFDDFPPEARSLPRVGGLLNPDTERVLALHPDLVLLYGSQTEAGALFERAGIRIYSYRHGGISDLLMTIRELGSETGHAEQAESLAHDLQNRLDQVRARVAGRARPRTLLVFGRERLSLRQIHASGAKGFLNDMLEIAGGTNVFADVFSESVQPSREMVLARAPEVILELRSSEDPVASAAREKAVWSALSSIPAVREGRIHLLVSDYLVVPGPRIVQATELVARALHPEAFP
jgi:iron complex transport system substrate-binding protein